MDSCHDMNGTTHNPKVEVIIKQENIYFLTSLLLSIDGCPLVAGDKPQKGAVKDFIRHSCHNFQGKEIESSLCFC